MRLCFADKEHRAIADLARMADDKYLLTRINVPKEHRRKGVGTALLKQVLAEADSLGVTLVVEVAGVHHANGKLVCFAYMECVIVLHTYREIGAALKMLNSLKESRPRLKELAGVV